MTLVRWRVVGALAFVVVLVTAAPAWADPAVPTHYRSEVTDVVPEIAGMTIAVAGGDAFLVVTVEPGHVLEVPGYFSEPYLRIDGDGTVWHNHLSPSRYINQSRYGIEIPAEADPAAAPDWRKVGSGGTYAWHDHRTHWMSRDLPPSISGDAVQLVFPWELEVVFDGTTVTVQGGLVWLPAVSPLGPLLVGLGGLLPLAWWRRGRSMLVAAALAGWGTAAAAVSVMQYLATPIDRGFPSELILPATAMALAVASRWWRATPIRTTAAGLLAGSALVIWGISQLDVLGAPVLPSALPPGIERSLVALILESAVALVGIVLIDGVLTSRSPDGVSEASVA